MSINQQSQLHADYYCNGPENANIKQNNCKSNKCEMKNAQHVESNVRSSETEYDVLK